MKKNRLFLAVISVFAAALLLGAVPAFAAEADSGSLELSAIVLPEDEDAPNYPEITKFENTNNGVMVSWTAFPGADSYRLFYWNGEKWRSIGSTSELSYLHKTAENDTMYLYTVRAEDEWGEYCSDFNHDGYENAYPYDKIDTMTLDDFHNITAGSVAKNTAGKVVSNESIDDGDWHEPEIDLSSWIGQTVKFKVEHYPLKNNSHVANAFWSRLELR